MTSLVGKGLTGNWGLGNKGGVVYVLMCYCVGTNVLLCNHLMCGIWCYGFCIKGLFFSVVKSSGFCVKSSCSSEVS